MSEETPDNAPPAGSQKGDGEWKPPSDGSWLPKVRVDEMVSDAKGTASRAVEEANRLRVELDAERAKQAKPADVKPVSRAELKLLVDDGKITQDAADAIWEKQIYETAERKAETKAVAVVAGQQRDLMVRQQLKEYRDLVPAAWEVGAKERAKVEREYKALVALGLPENQVTDVAALRAALGDPEVIRASRSTGKNGPGEAHVEVGGGERPGEGTADADGKPKGLTPREEAHYQNLINRGVVKDWKAVTEERKFAKAKA